MSVHILKLLCLLCIFSSLISCQSKSPGSPGSPEYNASVLYEIFPAMGDSIFSDNRFFEFISPPPPPPPPPPRLPMVSVLEMPFFYKLFIIGYYKEIRGTYYTEFISSRQYFKEIKDSLRNDDITLVMAVSENVVSLGDNDKKKLEMLFANSNLVLDSTMNKNDYKLDIQQLKANKKYDFKYISGNYELDEILPKYEYVLNGIIEISSIYFDTTYSVGYFIVKDIMISSIDYKPKPVGEADYLVKIIKNEKNWEIESVDLQSTRHF